MKRTYNVSIGGMIFHIEEDAYARLEMYLESVRTHFAPYPDGTDIIADIEGRIADQCAQRGSNVQLVTVLDVDHIIDAMGSVDQFDDPASPEQREGNRTAASGVGSGKRQLLRDPDDMIIAGVAS